MGRSDVLVAVHFVNPSRECGLTEEVMAQPNLLSTARTILYHLRYEGSSSLYVVGSQTGRDIAARHAGGEAKAAADPFP